MIKYYCDKCGEEINRYHHCKVEIEGYPNNDGSTKVVVSGIEKKQLCSGCSEKLKLWFENNE